MQRSIRLMFAFVVLGAGSASCTHQISLHPTDTSWHYKVDGEKVPGSALIAVVDDETAGAEYAFRAWSTGVAHKWVADYGVMLEQVADVELPQVVEAYKRTNEYAEPANGERRVTLVLTVPKYVFEDYHAKLTLRAEAFGPRRTPLFDESYEVEGMSQTGKMIGAGAFGQKSAVRQSSLDAYKLAFEKLRADLDSALRAQASAGTTRSAPGGGP